MFTNQQFVNNECSQSEYYSQFITDNVRRLVIAMIGRDRIINSIDPNFNDIPLYVWDRLYQFMYYSIGSKFIQEYGEFWSIGFAVGIAKEAAHQIKSKNFN